MHRWIGKYWYALLPPKKKKEKRLKATNIRNIWIALRHIILWMYLWLTVIRSTITLKMNEMYITGIFFFFIFTLLNKLWYYGAPKIIHMWKFSAFLITFTHTQNKHKKSYGISYQRKYQYHWSSPTENS